MKKFYLFLCGAAVLTLSACDLQPKILSLPDTVGEFISARYPALLADPETQPEIYNSAATDYGVYASPELYGSVGTDDYVVYASVNDYIIPPQNSDVNAVNLYGDIPTQTVVSETYASVDAGGEIVDAQNIAVTQTDDFLVVPMYGGQGGVSDNIVVPQKTVSASNTKTTRVELQNITVGAGDTLYSLSRKYSIPVNDLAVMNNINAPFVLSVGQKLKVPKLSPAQSEQVVAKTATYGTPSQVAQSKTPAVAPNKAGSKTPNKSSETKTTTVPPKQKISSDPTKKLPSIGARSSSKFSWPVRGNILSHFGAKSNGLFNDGINIAAARGTAVKAAENGVVAYAGNEVKGMGNLIIIQHAGGWMTVYAHMDSMSVRRGTKVSVGQKIGTVGETGKVDRPQLHFEIRKGTKAYNPSSYLKK